MSSIDSSDKAEEIKNQLDIVEVIGRDIALHHKSGSEYVGTVGRPGRTGESLKVDRSKQVWYDFKNGTGGDVLDWIGYINRLDTRGSDFPEVLRIAADLAGVQLKELTEEEWNAVKEKADIQNIFTDATDTYHNNLKAKPELYEFIEREWGINRETVDLLKIGYATTGWNLKNLDQITLKKSGMVYVNDGMISGEVFTGRIIIPYWKNGKVVYLIGRKTEETPKKRDGSDPPKYQKLLVHSDKFPYVSPSVQNSYFYNEDSLRGSDYVIITEGVTDCIVMLQAGFPCISPVTVKFREKDHPKLISLTKGLKRVYICNDNEANEAGLKGALSTAEILEKEGIETRLIKLPKPDGLDKIDIAEYMKEHSKEDFKELMLKALGLWDFKLNMAERPDRALDKLRAFEKFIRVDLEGMKPGEWKVFVTYDVIEKFGLKKQDARDTVSRIERERNREALRKEEEATQNREEQNEPPSDPLSKYPKWAIDKANDILDNGDTFQFILNVWQKKHVGDTNIGENCLCSVITRNILNSARGLHIKPSGDSGKGKSDAIECFLELLPEWVYITGSISAKALFYDEGLKPGTIIYSDDASFSEDVIATIKQSTSKFQKETVHRTVSNGVFQVYRIPERVTFWFSAVEGMDDEQLANRFLHAEVDNSKEQDLRVHQHQKEIECWYESDMVEPDILICRCIFDILYKEFYRVKIPFADLITWNNMENRRNFDKFKDVIKAVTVYNCRKRENFAGFLLATPEDFERALKIYKGTSVNNATNLTDTEIKYLRYIVLAPQKTVTVKMLVNHFKVSDIAVRNMINGKKGNGGLLAKVKQLVVHDESTTINTDNGSKSSREKRYQYTGEFTSLDLYESIAGLDYSAVERVTNDFKARLHENIVRVTQGNPDGNLSEVTHKNDCSKHNYLEDNNNITINSEYKSGSDSSIISDCAVIQPEGSKKENNFYQDTPQNENLSYADEENSQLITKKTVTLAGYGGLPQVTIKSKNDLKPEAEGINTQGYPDTFEDSHDTGSASLLRRALNKLANSQEYNGIVEDIHDFVKVFNERTPEYKTKLGQQAILYNAEMLKMRGWK